MPGAPSPAPCRVSSSLTPCPFPGSRASGGWARRHSSPGNPLLLQTDVFIAMELMGTCAEKLKKRMQGPIPERILGKMTVAVSGRGGRAPGRWPWACAPGHMHPPLPTCRL